MSAERRIPRVWRSRGFFLTLLLLTVSSSSRAQLDEQPSWLWLNAYVLVQTSNQLEEQGVWPLALAGYTAAHTHFQDIADCFPNFQPRLLAYRLKALKARIQSTRDAMDAGDHDLTMRYADFLETADLGTKNRISLDFPAAYEYLSRAQWQLDEIIRADPDTLGSLMARQREHLQSLAEHLRDELMKLPNGARILFEVDRQYSFAVVSSPLELPADPDVPVSANLFP